MSPKQFVNHPSKREAGADQVSRVAGCGMEAELSGI